MLLSSVIIILREVLEAALIISVFQAFSHLLEISRRWMVRAFFIGGAGAMIYAFNINQISELMDGIGQELTNATLHLLIYMLLALFNVMAIFQWKGNKKVNGILFACILASVVLAIIREGSEILLFLYGFVYVPDQMPAVLIGGTIGAGIGFSIGIIFYYLFVNCPDAKLLPLGIFIIILIGAGMVSQATQQLIQADLLPSQRPLWDSSEWMSEDSVVGQLFYVLMGYESTPTPLQVIFYLSSITIMMLLAGFALLRKGTLDQNRSYDDSQFSK